MSSIRIHFLFGWLMLIFGGRLAAQCDRVGWVAANNPACGVKIIDLESGERLWAVAGAENLVLGQTIAFRASPAPAYPACSPNDTLPKVALTCISNSLPCKADFVPYPDNLNPFTLRFSAQVYDPATQTCTWDFGDGTTGTGAQAVHTYPYEGYFKVTLTVSSADCKAVKARNVFVSEENQAHCGYDVAVTAVGMNIFGQLSPIAPNAGELTNIQWYLSKSNLLLGNAPAFEYTMPGYGSYNVCAEYKVESNDGSTCSATHCERLSLAEPGCINTSISNPQTICPSWAVPVCGCDGVTYGNECEAIAAGVTTWWAGACGSSQPGDCMAEFEAKVIAGSPYNGYWVQFKNLASGDFGQLQLDFGDGSPMHDISNWDTLTHYYPEGGLYLANLTAWKNGGCISSATKIVATDLAATENVPDGSEYVLPGDANGDRKANVYDLLQLGMGYFSSGSPRPFPSTLWEPQLAPNWSETTGTGINFKHMDCDGNGAVNELDPSVITQHCAPIDSNELTINPTAPKIWLDFSENPDTIFIYEGHPTEVKITADVMVATPNQPVSDLYGLAFGLHYPESVKTDPEVDYYDNSGFGFTNHVLWMQHNYPVRKQLDLGFVRKNGQGVSGGAFRVAKVTFKADYIIIVDIIARAANTNSAPFAVNIKGLKAIDPKGVEKELSRSPLQDTVWVKLVKKSTGTQANELDNKIAVFPNPAVGEATVFAGDLAVESVEVFNTLGQPVRSILANGARNPKVDVSGLTEGVYTFRIRTAQGVAEKKVIVH